MRRSAQKNSWRDGPNAIGRNCEELGPDAIDMPNYLLEQGPHCIADHDKKNARISHSNIIGLLIFLMYI